MEGQSDSCLVLYIEEKDNSLEDYPIDTKLFITYDFVNDSYVLYGKREDTLKTKNVPYFFRCDYTSELYDFLKFILGNNNNVNITMYNYNNMPLECEHVDYEFMDNNRDTNYELVGYDNVKIDNELKKMLRNLKNMYNFY
jgi:hypothetical protein